jgi:glycosyltransferase involved in cell wall biosynthesis
MGDPLRRLVVILPAFNEAATIATVLDGIPRVIGGVGAIGALVVDDGSSDDTAEQARAAGVEVIGHDRNFGVGRAFATGCREALRRGADLIVNIDADGQFDPANIPTLIAPILAGAADMVTCTRFASPAGPPGMPALKRWGNGAMSTIISHLTGQRFSDVSCGFRAYSREAALRLTLFGDFTYTQESLLELAYKGMRIREVALAVAGARMVGRSRVASDLGRYARKTLAIIVRAFRDYRPMAFFLELALGLLCFAVPLSVFFLVHRLVTGSFSPHLWAGCLGAFLIGLAFLCAFAALVSDSSARIRKNLEQLLYMERARFLDGPHQAVEFRPLPATAPGVTSPRARSAAAAPADEPLEGDVPARVTVPPRIAAVTRDF